MNIKLEKVKDVMVIKLSGDINMTNSNELRERFLALLKKGQVKVLMDFEKVDFIDSSGIATLIEMFRNLQKVGGRIYLCQVNKKIVSILEITKVNKLFPMFENRAQALQELE